jgi:carbamoyl-phosphate synthase large subunit
VNKLKNILVFGGGQLQLSIIEKCHELNYKVVLTDLSDRAIGIKYADHFICLPPDDFVNTCRVIEDYKIQGVITTATDKPLVMMAKIAEKYRFKFYSEHTAFISTNKELMKAQFIKYNIPCAKGTLIENLDAMYAFPFILKPCDNSGSRGVVYCSDIETAELGFQEAMQNSKRGAILMEEYIEGEEYSVEALHCGGKTHVIQVTQKMTTEFPYNVELGHMAPANVSASMEQEIKDLIHKIAQAFQFDHCGSHTEIKIRNNKLVVIETSPRLGGDYITSQLVPLSTGFDMEKALCKISMGEFDFDGELQLNKDCYGIFYIHLPPNKIIKSNRVDEELNFPWLKKFEFNLSEGESVPVIKSSLDRYGFFIIHGNDQQDLIQKRQFILNLIQKTVYD